MTGYTYPRKRRIWPWIAIPLALAFCLGSAAFALGQAAKEEPGVIAPHTAGSTNKPPVRPTTPAAGKAAAVNVGPGTWAVPGDVKPGTYTTTSDGPCYWARVKDTDGELESILANGNLSDGDHGRVTVKKSDGGLELRGDCVWTAAK